jgi:DNA (cytosine-5)-methyltransferase 1
MGFDAEWCVLGADDVGFDHKRERIWILAHPQCRGPQGRHEQQPKQAAILPSTDGWDCGGSVGAGAKWWPEPDLPRVAYGVADQLDRIKAIGNGQVPLCDATAFEILYRRLTMASSPVTECPGAARARKESRSAPALDSLIQAPRTAPCF